MNIGRLLMLTFSKGNGEDWLIAGLGNPESRYDGTRHNVGFETLDDLAARWGVQLVKAKFKGIYGVLQQGDRKVYLLKPHTYMNLSGESIGALASYFKIPPSHIIVLCDDIDQQPGKLRIRPKGSAGGHNGLKSIIASLGSDEFNRIRIGVGKKPTPEYDLADWVLGRMGAEDNKATVSRRDDIEKACQLIIQGKLGEAQNRFNK